MYPRLMYAPHGRTIRVLNQIEEATATKNRFRREHYPDEVEPAKVDPAAEQEKRIAGLEAKVAGLTAQLEKFTVPTNAKLSAKPVIGKTDSVSPGLLPIIKGEIAIDQA